MCIVSLPIQNENSLYINTSCRVAIHTTASGIMEEENPVAGLGIQRQVPRPDEQEPMYGTRR